MSNDNFLILDVSGWLAPAILGSTSRAANRQGVPIEGPTKFFRRLFELLHFQNPGYFIVACDTPREKLVRRQWYDQYKINRPEKDELTSKQFKLCYAIMKELGFKLVSVTGWEADDVLASYAYQFCSTMKLTTIATKDKDAHQLLDLPRTQIFTPTGSVIKSHQVEGIWGVPPGKVRQVQALAGDSTDCIPGAKGIGPKKAAPLVLKYGSAKKVKAHAHELSPTLQKSLQDFDAELNLKLVTLQRELSLPEELEPWIPLNMQRAHKLLQTHGLYVD